MFYKNDFGRTTGGAGALLWPDHAFVSQIPVSNDNWRTRLKYWAEDVNLVPDLGHNLFSIEWFRGLATCFALCFLTWQLAPTFEALPAPTETTFEPAQYDELRSQMLTPLALGADSGRHMGPTDAVMPLRSTPERPMITLTAAIGQGDSFARALSRAGVSDNDITTVIGLIAGDVSPATLAPGTRLNLILGRRPSINVPRPLDALTFRARLDLSVEIRRVAGTLDIKRIPIAVDSTPLRVTGVVNDSIYRAARSAGAPPAVIQAYLRVIAQHVALDSVQPGDRFDIIMANRRAETGENEPGELMYAGMQRVSGRKIELLKWTQDGEQQWFEASGAGRQQGALSAPVSGRLTSGFGMRFHPILGYSRLHAGVDFGAPYGAPIYAVTDGIVTYAGSHGGHGNYVRLQHAGGIGTGYAHMSRIATYAGARVRRGQVIGYVGSTGLSTGPHLHYEVYRNGQTVNPMSIRFTQTAQLSGVNLAAFRARLTQLKALIPGGFGGQKTVAVPKDSLALR